MTPIPLYPLIVVPVAVAVYLFWRRLAPHLAVLRAGRPLERTDQPLERIKGLGVFVFGQQRLLRDRGPGLMHFFIFWGFVVLLATTGNYMTNGLVEAVLGWPLGGLLWNLAILVANVFIGLVLVSIVYAAYRRIVVRPTRSRPEPRRLRDPRADRRGGHHRAARRRLRLSPDPGPSESGARPPGRPAERRTGSAGRAGVRRLRDLCLGAYRVRALVRHPPAVQQAPPHPDQRAERLPAQPRAAWRAAQDGPRGGAGARRRAGLRRQEPEGPDLAAPARRPVVHRMRALHGVLSRRR